MTFETTLREKIGKASGREKNLLRFVLGEYQQLASRGPVSDDTAFGIVRNLIDKNREKVLAVLPEGDPRRGPVEEENAIFAALLPTYLTDIEVETSLVAASLTDKIKAAAKEGAAMGLAMKHFGATGERVEGTTVRAVVQRLRA